MGKKKQVNYRAEQARKRNAEKAAYLKKAKARKEFLDKHGKQLIIGAVALVLACVLIWLGCKWLIGPGGSIPNFFGTLRGVESDWVVTNTGTSSRPRYYKLAEYATPEGYTLDPDYFISTDENNQTLYYRADDETAVAASVYVSGVPNVTAAKQVETVAGFSYYEQVETGEATIGGYDVNYAYCIYDESEEGTADEDKVGFGSLCLYVDTIQDSCALVLINSPSGALSTLPTLETMLAEAETFMPLLTLP